ncbi:MAG: DMT family transporter [Bacillota bacterium]
MTKTIRANLLLLLTAMIWGSAFVAQDVAMDAMGPFTFNAVRMALAVLVLLPGIKLLDRIAQKRNPGREVQTLRTMTKDQKRRLITGGIVCGTVMAAGVSLQQYGLLYTSAGKAGFVTALYIVLVPLTGIFFKHRVRLFVWGAVALCTMGLFLLCVTENLTIGLGDLLVLISAFCFTAHILAVAHYSPQMDGVRLSCAQFIVADVIFILLTLFFEQPRLGDILAGWAPIVYAGVFSCGVAYTLQIIAQRDTAPAVASLLMSLESVFAVLAQWAILGDLLSPRELLGCLLMFGGIVIAQLPQRKVKAIPIKETAA